MPRAPRTGKTEGMMSTVTVDRLAPAVPRAARRSSYAALWRAAPGSALYLIAGFVLAIAGLGLMTSLFAAGVGLLVLVIGLPLVALSLLVARGFGVADRLLLRLTGLPEVAEPEWTRDAPGETGFWRGLTRPLRNGHYWTSLLHGVIVHPVLSIISFALTVTWIAVGLGGLTYWFWGGFLPPRGAHAGPWVLSVQDAVPWLFGGWSIWTVEVVLFLAAGVLFTLTMPWVLGGLARAHHAVAAALLGRWRADDLTAEVRAEAAARRAAVHAEDEALRRLERDIHDGPQQRLVRLQMDLAALERRAAAGDGESAADLAREARTHAKAALDELRALSSGVAPPLLQDRGPVAAFEAVAASCALPVRVEVDPALDTALSPELARAVYFVVAELLTNAVKHSRATAVTLRAQLRPGAAGAPSHLDVWVVDNGRGAAAATAGHGLSGLQERVAGLRGQLVIDSPAGGPTTVGAHLPLGSGGA